MDKEVISYFNAKRAQIFSGRGVVGQERGVVQILTREENEEKAFQAANDGMKVQKAQAFKPQSQGEWSLRARSQGMGAEFVSGEERSDDEVGVSEAECELQRGHLEEKSGSQLKFREVL